MADVFISYKSERRPAARHLSKVLEQNGFSVWYDYGLMPGEDFEKRLMAELAAARIVIVLWCEMSAKSPWVLKEATEAKAAGKLLPSRIQRIDYAALPDDFRRDDIVDLTGWDGAPRSHMLDRLLGDIGRRLGRDPAPQFRGLSELDETWRSFGAPSLATFALTERLKPQEEAAQPAGGGGSWAASPALEDLRRTWAGLDSQNPTLVARFLERVRAAAPGSGLEFEIEHQLDLLEKAAAAKVAARKAPKEEAARRAEEEAARLAAEQEARRRVRAAAKPAVDSLFASLDPDRVRAAQRAMAESPFARRLSEMCPMPTAGRAARDEERRRAFSTPLSVFRDALRSGGEGPEMVVIPEGAFMMGSPTDEPERNPNEGPQHLVRIGARFGLGKYAVTFDEYDAYCAASGAEKPEASFGRGRMPVINVSWEDAQGYCRWLSAETGAEYRLPSEAEWEYACRAGASTPFWWGREITPDQANYDGDFVYDGGGRKGVYRGKTEPVDAFEANPFGLYQMHGNVCEWCADAWNDSYDGAPDDGSAWMSGDASRAVLRGGAWPLIARDVRSAGRDRDLRVDLSDVYGFPGDVYGFRVARTIIPQ